MNFKTSFFALLATVAASAATAGTITPFTDLATFTAAVGPTTVEDFGPVSAFPIATGVLNSATDLPGIGIAPGDIVAGVTFSTPVGTGNFFNIDAGGGFDGGFLDRIGGGASDVLTVSFDVAQGAFGFLTNFQMPAFDVEILFAGGGSTVLSGTAPGNLSFFGYASSEQDIVGSIIGKTSGNSSFRFAVDDFRFTTQPGGNPGPAPVPLPAAGLLLIGGLAGLGALRRRSA